jgi:hypothetical protein
VKSTCTARFWQLLAALAEVEGDEVTWISIGHHAGYDHLIR